MFGLPPLTLFWVFGTPTIAIILAIIFAMTFRSDTEEWWTIDDLFKKK